MSWTTQTLGEICDEGGGLIRTGPFGSQLHESDYSSEGTPVVMPKDIVEGKVSEKSIARISDEHRERLAHHKLSVGDIVYGRRGDIGRQALITAKESGWLCGTGCLRITLGKAKVDPKFLHYFLRDARVIDGIAQKAVGATMPNLNTSILRSIPIRYPQIKAQRRIAAMLSAYDDLIENNTRRIPVLEEIAQRIYEEWFVRFRFPEHENVKMVETELGLIPEGWKVTNISSLVEAQYGYTESAQYVGKGLPQYLRGMDINKNSFIDWAEVPYCEISDKEFEKYRLTKGDVLVIRMANPGKVGVVEKNVKAVFASYLVRLKLVSDRITSYFLFFFLSSERYQNYISGASTGTTRKSASAPVITGIKLALPPIDIQRAFNDNIVPMRELLNLLLVKNSNLRSTRDFLLPKLISGEIDVSDFPEPETL